MNDKNCDYSGFFNALCILGFFFINPALGVVGVILWTVGAAIAARPDRPHQAPLLTPEQKAEREAARLRQDAEQHRRRVEVWARAVEAEDKLKLYAP
jgi:hypothetical protein